jgi:hypothetical protein
MAGKANAMVVPLANYSHTSVIENEKILVTSTTCAMCGSGEEDKQVVR